MKTNPDHPITHLKGADGTTFYDDQHHEAWIQQCKPLIGLTKREYFAAMAMQSMILHPETSPHLWANNAVMAADALIAELNKESI